MGPATALSVHGPVIFSIPASVNGWCGAGRENPRQNKWGGAGLASPQLWCLPGRGRGAGRRLVPDGLAGGHLAVGFDFGDAGDLQRGAILLGGGAFVTGVAQLVAGRDEALDRKDVVDGQRVSVRVNIGG